MFSDLPEKVLPVIFHIESRNHRAGRNTVHGAGGQGGDDVRVADGEGEIGVRIWREVV